MTRPHRTTSKPVNVAHLGKRVDIRCRDCDLAVRVADVNEANDVREKHESGRG